MIKPTRPKLNRFKYAAMLAGAMAVVAFPHAGLTAVASAQKVLDVAPYDNCAQNIKDSLAVSTVSQGNELAS